MLEDDNGRFFFKRQQGRAQLSLGSSQKNAREHWSPWLWRELSPLAAQAAHSQPSDARLPHSPTDTSRSRRPRWLCPFSNKVSLAASWPMRPSQQNQSDAQHGQDGTALAQFSLRLRQNIKPRNKAIADTASSSQATTHTDRYPRRLNARDQSNSECLPLRGRAFHVRVRRKSEFDGSMTSLNKCCEPASLGRRHPNDRSSRGGRGGRSPNPPQPDGQNC